MRLSGLLALCAVLGCGESHQPERHGGTAGQAGSGQTEPGQAGQGHAGQAGQAADPAVRAVVVEWLTQYDRLSRELCECQVGWGDFATLDECFGMIGSDASWADCIANAAVGVDTSALTSLAGCLIPSLEERADCLDAMPMCTKENVGNCTAIDRMCPIPDPAALLPIVVACPQTILLAPR